MYFDNYSEPWIQRTPGYNKPLRWAPVHLLSKLNKMFFGYFDPENVFLDNENK